MARTVKGAGAVAAVADRRHPGSVAYRCGHMPTRAVDFDLGEMLSDVRGMITAQATRQSIRVALHVTTRTPLQLKGDQRHLHEILLTCSATQ